MYGEKKIMRHNRKCDLSTINMLFTAIQLTSRREFVVVEQLAGYLQKRGMRSIIVDEFGNEQRIVTSVIAKLDRISRIKRKLGQTLQERNSQTIHAEKKRRQRREKTSISTLATDVSPTV